MKAKGYTKTHQLVLLALFFAMALILSLVESALPPLPFTVPGIKFGLSNIVVMYVLLFMGCSSACIIATLKSAFIMLVQGMVSGLISLCGGISSIIIMSILLFLLKDKVSYFLLSMFGAVFHNIGQFLAVSFLYTSLYLGVYLPILLVAGVGAGFITAVLLKIILPAFKKIGLKHFLGEKL